MSCEQSPIRQKRPGFAEDVYGRQPIAKDLGSSEMSVSGLAQRRSAYLPKLVELSSGFSDNSINSTEKFLHGIRSNTGNLKFCFCDTDKHESELAELYSYSEMDDFGVNFDTFIQYMKDRDKEVFWSETTVNEKTKILQELAWDLENADPSTRARSARTLLYILQGAYGDFSELDGDCLKSRLDHKSDYRLSIGSLEVHYDSSCELASAGIIDRGTGGFEKRCISNSVLNAFLVYESQFYQILCSVLLVEIHTHFDLEKCAERSLHSRQSSACNSRSASHIDLADGGSSSGFERRNHKSATLSDNETLRIVINCLYCMVENIRRTELDFEVSRSSHGHFTTDRLAKLREHFVCDLEEPLESSQTPLLMHLFEMMSSFVNASSPHYPIKKILLLSWKILLTILGDSTTLYNLKKNKRKEFCLPTIDDTFDAVSFISALNVGCVTAAPQASQFALRKYEQIGIDPKSKQKDSNLEDQKWKQKNVDEVSIVRKVRVTNHTVRTISRQIATSNSTESQSVEITKNDEDFATEKDDEEVLPKISISEGELKNESHESNQVVNENTLVEIPTPTDEENNGGDQTPKASPPDSPKEVFTHRLSLRPKILEKDIENFLQTQRQKHFGYKLPKDSQTLFGLPFPVQKSVEAMRRNLYTPISEIQIKDEDRFNKYPFSKPEFIEDNCTERLYRILLPNMTDFVIAILKVILASLPSSKAKNDAVTVLSDVLTPETDTNEMLSNSINLDLSSSFNVLEETVRVAIDINRHKEIIIKAASSILVLLLKFFRINHAYQFENFAQYLVLANCIPLILKFLDQNICRYFQSKHELVPFNFPQCALYIVRNGNELPQLNADSNALFSNLIFYVSSDVDHGLNSDSPTYFNWRNVYSGVQLVRVLNKLTKGKQARTMMLVAFKSAPVLKRCMNARVGVFQVYILKLLKMQARYLGRQWRKSNMELISAIYLRVRHRLNDNWAYANDTKKSFDFQQLSLLKHEIFEGELSLAIKLFNSRRYGNLATAGDCTTKIASRKILIPDVWNIEEFEPVDNSLQSVLSWSPQFSERFINNYEDWLKHGVFERQINWDAFCGDTKGIVEEIKY